MSPNVSGLDPCTKNEIQHTLKTLFPVTHQIISFYKAKVMKHQLILMDKKFHIKKKKRDCLCELVKDYMGGLDITYTCILYKIRS